VSVAGRDHPALNQPYATPSEPRAADPSSDAQRLRARADTVTRGAARAAVLGVNDGLVTNLCLILAVAGASATQSSVRLAGCASLLAGAFSMAAGEWVSVRSQVELYEGILDELRALLRRNPKLVLDELTDKLVTAGLSIDTARAASTELPLDQRRFFDFTARTVFGLNPDELGSPVTAALSSLALFSVGAVVPLLPWFVTSGGAAVVASVIATGVAGFAVGAWISRSAGRSATRGGSRQLAIIVAAAAVTYTIGAVFGTAVA
jgi:vacuolar iron transporter family protein